MRPAASAPMQHAGHAPRGRIAQDVDRGDPTVRPEGERLAAVVRGPLRLGVDEEQVTGSNGSAASTKTAFAVQLDDVDGRATVGLRRPPTWTRFAGSFQTGVAHVAGHRDARPDAGSIVADRDDLRAGRRTPA